MTHRSFPSHLLSATFPFGFWLDNVVGWCRRCSDGSQHCVTSYVSYLL